MASESSMNEAGRTSAHPFADLRSASRAKNRVRKHRRRYNNFCSLSPFDLPSHPEQQAHYLPECTHPYCPTVGTADGHPFSVFPADLTTASVSKFTKRGAYIEAQWSRPVVKHHSRVKNDSFKWSRRKQRKRAAVREIQTREWSDDVGNAWCTGIQEDMDQSLEYMDDLDMYRLFGRGEEYIESWDAWTEVGETFSKWCQRRIGEMRAVKEDRLRAKLGKPCSSSSPTRSTASTASESDTDPDEGYYSSSSSSPTPRPTTTLPIATSDKHAHALISGILTPRLKWQKYPRVHGFHWFGETNWYWHRNMSGCWYVTSYDCSPHSACYCAEFKDVGDWCPEGVQRYCLGEWFGRGEEGSDGEEGIEEWEGDVEEDGMDDGMEDWDTVSLASASEAWTEVDEDSELEFV